ncbi:hypothetical protein AVEN_129978-1, partial [Araneus ventricosus]
STDGHKVRGRPARGGVRAASSLRPSPELRRLQRHDPAALRAVARRRPHGRAAQVRRGQRIRRGEVQRHIPGSRTGGLALLRRLTKHFSSGILPIPELTNAYGRNSGISLHQKQLVFLDVFLFLSCF